MIDFKNFIDSTEKSKIASFDFDETLAVEMEPIWECIEALIDYSNQGYKIVIVTARDNYQKSEVEHFVESWELPVEDIICTNMELKGPYLEKIGAELHVDDNEEQLQSVKDHGVKAINTMDILGKDNH